MRTLVLILVLSTGLFGQRSPSLSAQPFTDSSLDIHYTPPAEMRDTTNDARQAMLDRAAELHTSNIMANRSKSPRLTYW